MYALIENNQVVRYPYYLAEIRKQNPNVSIPDSPKDADMELLGVFRVFNSTPPAVSSAQVLVEGAPAYAVENTRWEQVWFARDKTAEELAAEALALQQEIVQATQARLDDFARTRSYDGILSACTYATSSVPKFQAEGQYCVVARDETWATLYTILAEVEAGVYPMPTSFADIEPELPALVWP